LVFSARVSALDEVVVVVLRENSEGSSAEAQPYLDRLLALLAKQAGWQSSRGKYLTRREQALDYIRKERPRFGILSLGAFLALRTSQRLKVIGQVELSAPGGRQYFLVSKSATELEQCKGRPLASNHLEDQKFIQSIVAAKLFRLADFTLVATRRPVQTLKAAIRDEAQCALVDDAQLTAAKQIEGGAALKVVWKSRGLPPMPVVAFPLAGVQQVSQFQKALPALCNREGAEICKNVGIVSLRTASDASYRDLYTAYTK
jgi:hypothetical protein